MPIRIVPLAGALGAEIMGMNLAQDLDDEAVAMIRRAWLDHLVLFFRDQHELTPDRFLAFARRFGQPVEYPFVQGLAAFPEIIEVVKRAHERINFGGIWHSDTTYLETPPSGTMLIARELPPFGGDTIFANQHLAYETLSRGMRQTLDGLVALNSSAKADVSRTREDRIKDNRGDRPHKEYVAAHPVVRIHPETGRRALYVNIAHTLRFGEMSEAESAPILNYLYQHQVRPEFTCRFRWTLGSVAFWDNRATQHNPVNDYHGYERRMHRITLAGDRPR